jgi:hypothetical protein
MFVDPAPLRQKLAEVAPALWAEISAIAGVWAPPITENLRRMGLRRGFPKTINDPVWGTVDLLPSEIAILDSPMLQRLRGVRQLGMGYLVYPGAVHDRLEHTLGVLEASQRMMDALVKDRDHRRRFGIPEDESIPEPSKMDTTSTRLGALFHDVGHGPCSHVLESQLRSRLSEEFERAEVVLRDAFAGVVAIATSETVSSLVALSEPMRPVLEHPRFATDDSVQFLPAAVASRILGSRDCLTATYLSGVLSGPLDADKLDYMARDSHHAGLPVGIDVKRLISKLQVVTVTPQNAPNESLRTRARTMPNERFHELGISVAGLGAYEQMVISRVILYDRLYYHHKVRSAEAMVRRLTSVAGEERGRVLTLSEMLCDISDRGMLGVLSGELKSDAVPSGGVRSRDIGRQLLDRRVYHRAFAFAARFIDGLDGLPQEEQADTRALLWNGILDKLLSPEGCDSIAFDIFQTAGQISKVLPEFKAEAESLKVEQVTLDLPVNKVIVRGGDILTRTEAGNVGTPNLFFDPEKWSQAYEQQKQCGFVFTPKEYVPLVSLASKVVFYTKFQTTMGTNTDRACKLEPVDRGAVEALGRQQVCSVECVEALVDSKPHLILFDRREMPVPDSWKMEDPELAGRLAGGLNDVLIGGLPASMHSATLEAIRHLIMFVDFTATDGSFANHKTLKERELQQVLKKHLLSREVRVQEGTEIGGGESDLVLPGPLVVENKVRPTTANPFEAGPDYVWQARRYSIAVSSRISFVVLAYRPASENAILPKAKRIAVAQPEFAPVGHVQIRVVVPWGEGVPSSAKAPER